MKKLVLAVVIAALALTLAPLAVAGARDGGGGKVAKGKAKFNLVGKVTAVAVADITVDPAAVSSLTIKVKAGSHIKGLKGKETVFVVAADAKVRQLTKKKRTVVRTLADLAAGDRVMAKGKISKAEDGSKVYTITSIKYRDLTPDDVAPDDVAPPAAE